MSIVKAAHNMEECVWSFLRYKGKKTVNSPAPVFLHSVSPLSSKFLVFGGCDGTGEAESSLFLYDSSSFLWHSAPIGLSTFQEDDPGPRYGHSATLVDNHPPRIFVYGGLVGGSSFEFDAPADLESAEDNTKNFWFRKKKRKGTARSKEILGSQDFDDRCYFLELQSEKWVWSKPLIGTGSDNKIPEARTEHTCCKIGTNTVAIFGGWVPSSGPSNELWTFDTKSMTWDSRVPSGIQPRPRYRHTAQFAGNKMYIIGGSDNPCDSAATAMHILGLSVLDCDTFEWSHPKLNGPSPFPRSSHCSALLGSMNIAIFGGKRSSEELLNDCYMLDLPSLTSTRVICRGDQLPMPVANPSMCSIGRRIFVFGGVNGDGVCFNDIRILDVGTYTNPEDTEVGDGVETEFRFKMLIIGNSSVGKSALLNRFVSGKFQDDSTPTVGIDYSSKTIMVEGSVVRLEMWDTAGQERFSTMTATYYRGAQGALVCYDVTNRESFERAQMWFDRARELGGKDLMAVLVATKMDLPTTNREVSKEQGHDLAAALGIPFMETSSKDDSNVESAFVTMAKSIKKDLHRRGLAGVTADHLGSAGGVSLSKGEYVPRECC
jgi:small GTP-binding protein